MKLPLRIHKAGESFGIRDAAGAKICYVYFDLGNAGERAIRGRMSETEAEAIAKRIARFLTDSESEKTSGQPD